MSYYLVCTVETVPCPDVSQAVQAAPTLADFAAMGITGTSLSVSVGFGAGIVFMFALLAFGAGAAIKLIRDM